MADMHGPVTQKAMVCERGALARRKLASACRAAGICVIPGDVARLRLVGIEQAAAAAGERGAKGTATGRPSAAPAEVRADSAAGGSR